MMPDQNRKILEIPVERISVTVRVKNPMVTPVEAVRDADPENLASASASLKRLFAFTQSFTDNREYLTGDITLELVRDFCLGQTWHPKTWQQQKEPNTNGDEVVCAQPNSDIDPLCEELAKQTVSDLVAPYQVCLSHRSCLDRDEALHGTELIDFKLVCERDSVTMALRRVDRGNGEKWVPEDSYVSADIQKIIAKVPELQPTPQATTDENKEWDYAPEVDALQKLETASANERIEVARDIVQSITPEIEKFEFDHDRLNSVSSIVGFRSDMWNAAQAVIHSTHERVFVLSSFSNLKHIADATERIAVASDNKRKVAIAFGEPDRGHDPDDIKNTEQYIARMQESPNIKCGISPQPTHAKVVVSDKGMVFICSCNLFSGSMNSAVLESGLLIKDVPCAIKIIRTMQTEKWVPDDLADEVQKLLASLQKLPADERKPVIDDKLHAIKHALDSEKKRAKNHAVDELKKLLRLIAERPAWSLLVNSEHQQFMRDCAGRFTDYLGLASDGLRRTGLDPTTADIIAKQAKKSGGNVNMLVWWGRHAPGSKPYDENDKRGREEAAIILKDLRQKAKKGKWQFAPSNSDQPMETHAKLFVVDGLRLMVSSDNTLSFGDAESGKDDAGELGLVIDHPRLAMQTRGCMELYLPEARKHGDWNRWWAALAEEVYYRAGQPSEKIPLTPVLDALMDRIQKVPSFKCDWQKFESGLSSGEIRNNLVRMGDKHGLFSVSMRSKKVALSPSPVWQKTTTNNRR